MGRGRYVASRRGGRKAGNGLLARKLRSCKSVEKDHVGPYHPDRTCQTGIIRTRFSAADFRLNRVIRLANTGGY